jgi:hypothetical protein
MRPALMKNTVSITVFMPEALRARIDAFADTHLSDRSKVARKLFEEALAARGWPDTAPADAPADRQTAPAAYASAPRQFADAIG